ncbi:MAG TPA: hypothetical protein VLE69_03075 [Candidatus Saccharimonadales bacterium]|nr:hypothetical protein [Candidatus Saccharimonadales bacterium]
MNYSICVSGAAGGKTVASSKELAERVGTAIGKSGHTITTGATVGLPYYAAKAAKKVGGMSVGFSPAASLREHVFKYRLPIGVYDFVNFTGMHYVGRDIHLVQSSDAVITVGGRFGSLHEFTTALESDMVCGILLGSGGTADLIPELLERLEEPMNSRVVTDTDPEQLVKRIIAILDKDIGDINTKDISNSWFLDDKMTTSNISKH